MSPMGKCRMGKCRYGYMSHGYMSPNLLVVLGHIGQHWLIFGGTAGVSIFPYLGISIPRKNWVHFIKNSNFSRFYKKNWVHFIKKLRCDKFGN